MWKREFHGRRRAFELAKRHAHRPVWTAAWKSLGKSTGIRDGDACLLTAGSRATSVRRSAQGVRIVRVIAHIVLAALVVSPSLAVPSSCGARQGVAAGRDRMQSNERSSCCASNCMCPASTPTPETAACAGATCAGAPVEPGDQAEQQALLPTRVTRVVKSEAGLTVAPTLVMPPASSYSRPHAPVTARLCNAPPGELLLTLCRFLI